MNFVKQVEEQLRDLGTESRHKHPGVKEASERAILSLRLLQNKYVAAVRQATRSIGDGHNAENHPDGIAHPSSYTSHRVAHPTTQMFQSQDILRPFLLAANYPNVGNRILQLSLDGIQTLLAGQAICKQDGVHVVRVLHIQATVCAAAIYGKNHASYGSSHGVGSKGGGGVTLWGSMVENYINIPSAAAGSVVNAGVGTISNFGSSILSGFGFKSGMGGTGSHDDIPPCNSSSSNVSDSDCGVVTANAEHGHNVATTAAAAAATVTDHSASNSSEKQVNASRSNFVHPKRSVGSAAHASHRTAKEDEAICIRILQILAIMIGSEEIELSEELLSQCIGICLILGACASSDVYVSDEETRQRLNSLGRTNKFHEPTIFKFHGARSVRKKEGPGGSRAQNVSSAARATFRQIISTLFSRAAAATTVATCDGDYDSLESMETTNSSWNEKCLETTSQNDKPTSNHLTTVDCESFRIQSLAAKTLSDLCCLAECKNCNGPIGQALLGQQRNLTRPSQYVCFSLMDMILDQHFDLFVVPNTFGGDTLCFKTLLKDRIFPLVTRLISNFGKGNGDSNYSYCEDPSPLALMLKLTIMATSIVTKNCQESSLTKQCQNLIMAIAIPVKCATNLLRDSHDFEDGFIYCTDTIDELKHQTEHEKAKFDETSLITLWAATISIEAIYSLVSKHFKSMLPVFSAKESDSAEDSLLSSLISIICDFVVVASSSKPSISKLVQAVESNTEYQQEEEEVLDDVRTLKCVPGEGNHNNLFLREESFVVRRIRPLVISNAKSMTEYDLGGTVWVAMNCIIISWRCLQTCNLNEEANLQLVGGCFGPSLVVIQHFLRRCPASEKICRSSLSAYLCLSRVSLPIHRDRDSRREVILATLCKLTVPVWVEDNAR
jgi:hypothetical protein